MAYPVDIREEELKKKVAADFFGAFDTTRLLGNVDFAVAVPCADTAAEIEYLLWAEAKKGVRASIEDSFVQLVITIGKARTFERHLPPRFLGAFDAGKIAFIEYKDIQDIFHANDFNWNVTPSDHATREFAQVRSRVADILDGATLIFRFDRDRKELERFVRRNFRPGGRRLNRIRISKNNFVYIYQKWLEEVKPSIAVDWDEAKAQGILDADFYLADILSRHNQTLRDKLFVLLRDTYYELDRRRNAAGLLTSSKTEFNDGQKAHRRFWNRYDRPPHEAYWDYIVERRDLLVPPDVRERKGSFFTPQPIVELSQRYLAEELGEDWQDEYYVWDCAAGTGNLLNGLTEKYRIWASTLDRADVDVMKERARNGAANLLEDHIFQFDFLNDSFDKLPPRLREIIDDEEKRRRLVIYINPPYAEAATTTQKTGSGRNKAKVADTQVARRLKEGLGPASNELFAQFLMRAYTDIPLSVLANFSTLKNLQAPNFHVFRKHFQARLARIFLVPASLFDNVKGFFPIGFFIWRTAEKEVFTSIKADVYDRELTLTGRRNLYAPPVGGLLMDWLKTLHDKEGERIAYLRMLGSDVQNNAGVFITNTPSESDLKQRKTCNITRNNLLGTAVYFAVRMVVDTTWVNDRDQYLFPQPGWSDDRLFQADCLAYTLFSGQNRINAAGGVNYWIPFTEEEVDARDSFRSHFMSDFISGRKRHVKNSNSWVVETDNAPLEFSEEAKAVLDAGRELWRYYHAQEDADPDASFYDIKMYFQGTKVSKSGKVQMRPDSDDAHYTELIGALRSALKALAAKIEPKVYEHGFLKR